MVFSTVYTIRSGSFKGYTLQHIALYTVPFRQKPLQSVALLIKEKSRVSEKRDTIKRKHSDNTKPVS